MAGMAIAELTIQERGILATSATAVYLDCFSSADGVSVSAFQQPVLLPRPTQVLLSKPNAHD